MALAGSLCLVVHAVTGFTNKSLRGQVAGLLAVHVNLFETVSSSI
jgi:hypothetical protein